jgi:hypothetical protein
MANILSLALKINADASGLKLDPVQRALVNLGNEADKLNGAFARFAGSSEAAAKAQERTAQQSQDLINALRDGTITSTQFAAQFERLTAAAEAEAAAFEKAARITEANLTAFERFERQAAELKEQLDAGRITQETYNRALEGAAKGLTDAERAAAGLAARTKEIESTGSGAALQFNELSGVFSALPGPLGNIAGRISGISSAGEGLARVFQGGLSAGISGVATSITSLINPFTAAVAGVAAFGAAATAVVNGLTQLDDRVEKLGNTADKLGVSFGFIQDLEEAARRSGTSIDAVSAAFGRLQKSVLGVDEESKAAQAALENIGVTAAQLQELKPEQQYELIGQRLAEIEDPARRTAAATALFGKAGADLIPFFNNLAGARVDMERFNGALSDIDRTRVDSLGASFDTVAVSLRGFGQELLTPFIGITQSISDGVASTFASVGRNVGALLDALSPLTSGVGLLVNAFLQGTSIITNFIGIALEPAAFVGRTVASVYDNISQVITKVAGRINDAIVGFREFFKFEAVAERFRGVFDAVGTALAKVGEVVERIGTIVVTALSQLGGAIGETFGNVVETIGGGITAFTDFLGLTDIITGFTETVTAAFGGLWQGIKDVVGQVGGFIEQVLQFAEDWLGIKREVEQPVVATVEFDGGGAIDEILAVNKDFQKTLDSIDEGLNKAIDESAQFGQAGFDAALRYQESIKELKRQLDQGFFNEETFRQQAEAAGVAFKQELARIEEDAKLEIQIEADAQKTLAGLNEEISKAIEGAKAFGQEGFDAAVGFQDQINELKRQFEAGIINETALKAGVAAANAEYDNQIAKIKQVQEEQKKIIEDDQKRIEGLIGASDAASKVEQDILAVQREQARVAAEIAAARADGQEEAATAAAARLAQLDQVQASLEDQQQALEQGFGQGFGQAFQQVDANISKLIDKSAEFGQAGFDAGLRLQEGIAKAQEQARDGILNKEAFDQQVAQQQKLFEQELKNIDEANKAREKAADDAAKKQKQLQQEQLKAEEATQKALFEQQRRQEEEIRKEQERFQQERENVLNQIAAKRQAEFERDVNRIQELNTLGPGAIQGIDVRTQQGADLVLGLALSAQDPALIEQRLQTKLLQQIADAALEQVVRNVNAPVALVGMARLN